MVKRYFNKTSHIKYVKPYVNKRPSQVPVVNKKKEENEVKAEKEVVKENKETKKEESKDMMDKNKLNQLLDTLGAEELPKRKAKVEKKDKGLIERADNTKVILTEDNRQLLSD